MKKQAERDEKQKKKELHSNKEEALNRYKWIGVKVNFPGKFFKTPLLMLYNTDLKIGPEKGKTVQRHDSVHF